MHGSSVGGKEALHLLRRHDDLVLPDLILLDVTMPDISGYEVCKEIRRRFPLEKIPIIMVTAKGSPEEVTEGLESGANDYVKKPFHRKELLSRVRAQITTNKNDAEF